MSRKTILVMFSGGLDSVYVLHKILTDSEYAEYDVHVHHMRLINSENRAAAEEIAVKNVVDYLRTNGYRPFILSFTDLTYPEGTLFRDAFAVSMIGGQISGQDPMIEKVAIGINATDMKEGTLGDIRKKSAEIFGTFSKAEKIYPAMHLSKLEVRDALPLPLRELSWSCRTPRYVEGKPMKCNKCSSCKQLRSFK